MQTNTKRIAKKRIALFTWFGFNYGTALQSIALYKFLEKHNDVLFIEYCDVEKIDSFAFKIKQILRFLLNPIRKLKNCINVGNIVKGFKIYNEYEALKRYRCDSKKKIKKLEKVDILITGSDQIWNPYYLNDLYLLKYFNNKNKIAYSSSIGVNEIPKDKELLYKECLSKFSNIAVREKTAETLLKTLLNRNNIYTVMDPVFLWNKEEWLNFFNNKNFKIKNKPLIKEDYIFCYFIGSKLEYNNYVKTISNFYNLPVVYVPSIENRHILLDGKCIKTAGLDDFIHLISNAKLLLTDSFHATSFSIILRTQFIEFLRFDKSDSKSQNSRIFDLLEKYGLSNRLYDGGNIPVDEINFEEVADKLGKDIDFSISYLNKALGDC